MLNVIPAPLNKAGNISVMYFSDIFSPIFLIKNALLGLTLRGRTHRVSTSCSHLLTQNASLGWLPKRKSPHSQIGYEGEWNRGSTSCSQTAHAACLNKFDNQPLAVTGYPRVFLLNSENQLADVTSYQRMFHFHHQKLSIITTGITASVLSCF